MRSPRFRNLQILLMSSVAAVGALAIHVGSSSASPTDPVNPLTKRFVQGKALDICDQGALFIGGVPKVTNYLNSATAVGAPDQIIIGKMYVQFQIPTKHRKWPLIMVHGSGYTGSAWMRHRTAAKAGFRMRCKTIFQCSWWIRLDAGARASTNPCSMRQGSRTI